MENKPFEFTDTENVEPEFLKWWRSKDFSGYPWTRREVQLIALLAWRDHSKIQDDAYTEALAEIERLKAEGLRVLKLYQASLELLVEKDKLIGDLADALSDNHLHGRMLQPSAECKACQFLQRAREALKDDR